MGSVELDTAERLSAHKVYGKIFFSSDGSKIKTFVRFRVPVIDFSLLIFNYFILLIWRALVSRRKCYVHLAIGANLSTVEIINDWKIIGDLH